MLLDTNKLLKLLEETFPDKLPKGLDTSVEKLRVLQGEQRVVEWLKSIIEREEDEAINNVLI